MKTSNRRRVRDRVSILLFAILCLPVLGTDFVVNWTMNPNPPPQGYAFTAGYRVYYGMTSKESPLFMRYAVAVDAGNTNKLVISNLAPGRWFVTATAYSTDGVESDYATEASATSNAARPPTSPVRLLVKP